MWLILQLTEEQSQSEEDGRTYTDEGGVVRCKHHRDTVVGCMRCVEEDRQGLPPCHAVYEQEEGWFWLWKNPDPRVEETSGDGPFDNKEDCRWDAWEVFEEREVHGEVDEKGRKVEDRSSRL